MIRNLTLSLDFDCKSRCSLYFQFAFGALISRASQRFWLFPPFSFFFFGNICSRRHIFFFFLKQHTLLYFLATVLLLYKIGMSNCLVICLSSCFEQYFFLLGPFSHSSLLGILYYVTIVFFDCTLQSHTVEWLCGKVNIIDFW